MKKWQLFFSILTLTTSTAPAFTANANVKTNNYYASLINNTRTYLS